MYLCAGVMCVECYILGVICDLGCVISRYFVHRCVIYTVGVVTRCVMCRCYVCRMCYIKAICVLGCVISRY